MKARCDLSLVTLAAWPKEGVCIKPVDRSCSALGFSVAVA